MAYAFAVHVLYDKAVITASLRYDYMRCDYFNHIQFA